MVLAENLHNVTLENLLNVTSVLPCLENSSNTHVSSNLQDLTDKKTGCELIKLALNETISAAKDFIGLIMNKGVCNDPETFDVLCAKSEEIEKNCNPIKLNENEFNFMRYNFTDLDEIPDYFHLSKAQFIQFMCGVNKTKSPSIANSSSDAYNVSFSTTGNSTTDSSNQEGYTALLALAGCTGAVLGMSGVAYLICKKNKITFSLNYLQNNTLEAWQSIKEAPGKLFNYFKGSCGNSEDGVCTVEYKALGESVPVVGTDPNSLV